MFWIIMTYCETQTRTVRNSVSWAAYDTDTCRPTSKYNSNIQKPISALKKPCHILSHCLGLFESWILIGSLAFLALMATAGLSWAWFTRLAYELGLEEGRWFWAQFVWSSVERPAYQSQSPRCSLGRLVFRAVWLSAILSRDLLSWFQNNPAVLNRFIVVTCVAFFQALSCCEKCHSVTKGGSSPTLTRQETRWQTHPAPIALTWHYPNLCQEIRFNAS